MIEVVIGMVILTIASGILVVAYLTIFRGLSILTLRSMITNDLRRTIEQVGRDAALAQDAPATPPAICGGAAQNSASLVLVGPMPGIGAAAFADCVVYQCQPSPGVQPGPCNNLDPTADPSTVLGVLWRLVYSEAGGAPVESRPMARGVFSLGFTRFGGPPVRRVDILLGVRQRVQGFQDQGQITAVFTLRN